MLSRNFRLQKVGDLRWLKKNYDFSHIAFSIDELIVLDVSRKERDSERFSEALKALTEGCFVPIAAGGGIQAVDQARKLLRSGADKVVVNSALFQAPELIDSLAEEFGRQCIIGSLDFKKSPEGKLEVWTNNGTKQEEGSAAENLKMAAKLPIGELYLNSIDKDGTGQGYDRDLLELIDPTIPMPIILAGGAGNARHLAEGLRDSRVHAAATAHLFNFVGDGLEKARTYLYQEKFDLARWNLPDEANLKRELNT